MKKYPDIGQFRNVIKKVRLVHDFSGSDENGKPVYQHLSNYPTLKFHGTVKLHGTNSAVVKYSDGHVEFQSRERVLSLEGDNAGFMNAMSSKNLGFLFAGVEFNDFIAVYGEWCGGNIQKGVAINALEKMFVIFGVLIDDKWIELTPDLKDNDNGIYNILQFKTYEVDIDFNSPELVQNEIIDMTISVENECPAGKFLGVEGVGEGIVFTCISNPELKFKSKGEKHSSSRVKTISSVNVEEVENLNNFASLSVTENRLNQALSVIVEEFGYADMSHIGIFLSWMVKDVLKEEMDTISANGLDEKKVKSAIVAESRQWFLNKMQSL